jgi:hypothetical protein
MYNYLPITLFSGGGLHQRDTKQINDEGRPAHGLVWLNWGNQLDF